MGEEVEVDKTKRSMGLYSRKDGWGLGSLICRARGEERIPAILVHQNDKGVLPRGFAQRDGAICSLVTSELATRRGRTLRH